MRDGSLHKQKNWVDISRGKCVQKLGIRNDEPFFLTTNMNSETFGEKAHGEGIIHRRWLPTLTISQKSKKCTTYIPQGKKEIHRRSVIEKGGGGSKS